MVLSKKKKFKGDFYDSLVIGLFKAKAFLTLSGIEPGASIYKPKTLTTRPRKVLTMFLEPDIISL